MRHRATWIGDEGIERELQLCLADAQGCLVCRAAHHVPTRAQTAGFNSFFAIADPILHRYARARGVISADLDDCSQGACVRAIRALPRYDPRRGGISPLLYVLAERESSFWRHRRYRDRKRLPPEELDQCLAPPGDEPDSALLAEEQRAEEMRRAEGIHGRLAEPDWRLLNDLEVNGLSAADAGRTRGMTGEQVRHCRQGIKAKLLRAGRRKH